jgi:predicted nuclease of predicted toxin-antitoxin system
MKFLIDKALSPRTVTHLRDNGFHAVRVDEVIPGAVVEDEAIFAYAIEHEYHIITADLDFGAILAYTKSKKPSTIIFRLEDQRVSNVNRLLLQALPKITHALEVGSIIIIQDTRIRIKPLPI